MKTVSAIGGSFVLLMGGISTTGCENRGLYRLSQIEDVSASAHGEGEIQLSYRPMLESLYHSPGVVLVSNPDALEVQVVRCGIKEVCPVDHAASYQSDGSVRLTLPRPKVRLFMGDGEKRTPVEVR